MNIYRFFLGKFIFYIYVYYFKILYFIYRNCCIVLVFKKIIVFFICVNLYVWKEIYYDLVFKNMILIN